MPQYCIGNLVTDFDTPTANMLILFTVDQEDATEVVAKRDEIAIHMSELFHADIKGENLIGYARFMGCHFEPIRVIKKEAYEFMKQFTFEYKGKQS